MNRYEKWLKSVENIRPTAAMLSTWGAMCTRMTDDTSMLSVGISAFAADMLIEGSYP